MTGDDAGRGIPEHDSLLALFVSVTAAVAAGAGVVVAVEGGAATVHIEGEGGRPAVVTVDKGESIVETPSLLGVDSQGLRLGEGAALMTRL